jgi:tRNA(fMet)-specific endonuclease VapC
VSRYLVDTNAWIHYLRGQSEVLRDRIDAELPNIVLSAIVTHELLAGVRSSTSSKRTQAVRELAENLPVLPFDLPAAEKSAVIRVYLEEQGIKIGPMDTLIAGQCLAHDLTLVTNNTSELSRVPGLTIEDWQSE